MQQTTCTGCKGAHRGPHVRRCAKRAAPSARRGGRQRIGEPPDRIRVDLATNQPFGFEWIRVDASGSRIGEPTDRIRVDLVDPQVLVVEDGLDALVLQRHWLQLTQAFGAHLARIPHFALASLPL